MVRLQHLRDPWIFFSVLVIFVGFVLVILPQFPLFKASFQREGPMFQLKTTQEKIAFVPETLRDLELEQLDSQVILAKSAGRPIFELHSLGSGELSIIAINSDITIVNNDPKNLKIKVSNFIFEISQDIPMGVWGRPVTPRPLEVREVATQELHLSYHPGSYLTFKDKALYFTTRNYISFFQENKYITAIANSLIVSVSATLLASILAIPLACLLAKYEVPGKTTLITLITMASISPPFLGAYAWRLLLGRQGILTRFFNLNFTIVGLHGVIWVIAWLVFPLIFLLTYEAFVALDPSLREVSLSLGADKRKTFRRIEIPLALPGVITGLYIAMMTAFTDFGTPYIISLNLNVLPVLVYREYMNEVGSNFPIASTGSVIMLIISSFMLFGQRLYLARKSFASLKAQRPIFLQPTKKGTVLILTLASVLLLVAFIPHITVLITSFLKWISGIVQPEFTVENFIRMFKRESNSIYVSFFLGTTATLLDVLFGVGVANIIARKRYPVVSDVINLLVMVPYLIPGTVLAIGLVLLYNTPPVVLTGTWVILVLSYFIRKLPFSVKSAEAALYQIHPSLEEAAQSLGARPIRSFWDVTVRMMIGSVVSGALLSFLHVMTETSSTIILYRPPWKPMTMVIFENATLGGAEFGVASAMTTLLMVLLYVPVYIVTRYTRGTRGEKYLGAY
jgi:iron(III) transport system permease protein